MVAGPTVSAVDHVVALERGHGHGGCDLDVCGSSELLQRRVDMGKGQGRVLHGVELVDGKHQRIHAQQMGQQAVAAGLGQQLQIGILPVQLGGVDQHHGGVGARCRRDHIACVLLVTGSVADDELARLGGEVAVGHIDRDALFALGGQAVGQQGQIRLAGLGDAGQLILQHGAGVHQQATDQRALAVIDRAAGDKAQRAAVMCIKLA